MVVKRIGLFLGGIDPRARDLENEEIVPQDHAGICHATFKIAETFLDQGGADQGRTEGGSPKRSNLSPSRPEQLPTSATVSARRSGGIAITASRVERRAAKL
ncbi:nicotinate-nucleotide diphosphorylase [Bradyrhizobium oligotrophicum S58]|uniref:Nicotinate-nucleotide diphosphorylase n=1 Tax=Bradyrhizobium oligotrophicum S58 TaxID=1245469 RepID=M4ZCU9_9BRAD|nr:nicotinate-nucleotide diphosphorylase [Bradyrhizobium oligotrophicum S58]